MGLKKKHLIRTIANELEITLVKAEQIYATIVDEMVDELATGNSVKLSGFGSFTIVERKPKLGRNPRTGDRLRIPRHTSVRFKMGKHLIDSLNN